MSVAVFRYDSPHPSLLPWGEGLLGQALYPSPEGACPRKWFMSDELSSSPSTGEDSGEGGPSGGRKAANILDASADFRRHPLIPSAGSGLALAFSRQGRRDFWDSSAGEGTLETGCSRAGATFRATHLYLGDKIAEVRDVSDS